VSRISRILSNNEQNIKNYGFTYCGIIYQANGDERLAYQKKGSYGIINITSCFLTILLYYRGGGENNHILRPRDFCVLHIVPDPIVLSHSVDS